MFVVGEAVIDEAVAQARFACDLEQCRGACCTLPGGRGAPLIDEECGVIGLDGLFEGVSGQFSTTCVNDRDCVFVYYEGNVARCSLEKAWLNGESGWRKPVSCP